MTTIEPTLSAASTSLLSSLLANPFDTFRRGLLSDQLSDNREELPELTLPTGAVVVRDGYGLPWEVRCTMTQWCGERCRYCTGGYIHNDMHDSPDTCTRCKTTGWKTIPIAATVCRAWPIGSVVFTCRRPEVVYGQPNAVYRGRRGEHQSVASMLPESLMQMFDGKKPFGQRSFQSDTEAYAALNRISLALGRQRAGLPPIPPRGHTMTATTETEVMLMQAVLEAPGDDGPRLVLADWYEENGQGERAEFVRLQISAANNPDEWPEFPNRLDTLIDVEQVPAKMLGIGPDWSWSGSRSGIVIRPSAAGIKYIFRRGMVDEIECSALEWIGGPCRKCYIRREGEQIIRDGCNNCNWTGRVEGIARAVCERWPVTTVRLADKRSDNGAFWRESSGDNPNDPSILPEKLFNIMSKMYPNRHRSINRRGFSETQSEHNIYFAAHPKSISADDALSLTAVNYGRDLAGVPPL